MTTSDRLPARPAPRAAFALAAALAATTAVLHLTGGGFGPMLVMDVVADLALCLTSTAIAAGRPVHAGQGDDLSLLLLGLALLRLAATAPDHGVVRALRMGVELVGLALEGWAIYLLVRRRRAA